MQGNKQEKSQIKQKILLYLSNKGISAYEFYKKTGVTRGILTQNNGITEENLSRFLAYAPDINLEWLLTGKGEMLKTRRSSGNNSHNDQPNLNGKDTYNVPIHQGKKAENASNGDSGVDSVTTAHIAHQPETPPDSTLMEHLLDKIAKQAEEIGRLKARIEELERRRGDNAGHAQSSDIAEVG